MFGNNAFTRFQSQPAEDSAVSQKSPPKLGRQGQKLNLKALCFHDKPHGRLVDSPQESAAPSLISDPLSFFSSSEKAATLDKNLLSSSWKRSTSKKRRRRRSGGRCSNLFSPLNEAILSICLLLFQRRANLTVICSHNKSTHGGSAAECYATFIKRIVAATDHCSRARTRSDTQTLPTLRPHWKLHQARIRHLFKL